MFAEMVAMLVGVELMIAFPPGTPALQFAAVFQSVSVAPFQILCALAVIVHANAARMMFFGLCFMMSFAYFDTLLK